VRHESACAQEDLLLLSIPYKDYEGIEQSHIEKQAADSSRVLRSVDLFKAWGHQRVKALARGLERQVFRKKSLLRVHGEDSDSVFFIETGTVSVHKEVMCVCVCSLASFIYIHNL
jgi:hypothetical protein